MNNGVKNTYKPRVTDKILGFKLRSSGAVVIEGAKWCGKTTSAKRAAKSVMNFGDDTGGTQNVRLATTATKMVLDGDTPRLFDEWQEVPMLWDAIRYEVDRRNSVGQFILTGSAVPIPKKGDTSYRFRHSGVGRYSFLRMRPMSLYESGESNGKVSLGDLFAGKEIAATCDLKLDQVAFLACRGGWPFATMLEGDLALAQARNYYDVLVHSDISRVDDTVRNPQIVERIMRSYARNQGSQTSVESMARDANVDSSTAKSYLNALSNIFAVESIKAWSPNLRSRTAIRSTDTHYYVDPSIAASSLKATPDGLIGDLNTFGFIFETLCIRDLRVYAYVNGGEVYHYRDKNDLECDAVVTGNDGKYGLIEIKLGQDDNTIGSAVISLNKLADKIDTTKMRAPTFKAVLTANGVAAYRRPEDGVYVVPIGCLKD